MKKIFAIGDIHGSYQKLKKLMDMISVDPKNDILVFMGDYIDRGSDSFEVVDYLIELKKQYETIVFLKGNHEEMLLRYLEGHDRFIYLANGGQQTLESYMNHNQENQEDMIPKEHFEEDTFKI